MYIVGELYNRRQDIHALFGGQQQGGISSPKEFPYVFIFTGDQGHAYGYKDGWNHDGLYYYTGEGQVGDQGLRMGNKAILDHQKNGKELLLFKYEKTTGLVRHEGQMECVGYHEAERPDREGSQAAFPHGDSDSGETQRKNAIVHNRSEEGLLRKK